MSKMSICLGGVENGKMVHSDGEFYYVKNSNDLFTYKRVDLKFYRSIREDLYEYNYKGIGTNHLPISNKQL